MKIAIPTLIVACGVSCGCGFAPMFAAVPSNNEKPPIAPPTEAQAEARANAQTQTKARLQTSAKAKSKRGKMPVKTAASAASPIIVTITSDRKVYKRGQLVSFVITARNTGKAVQRLYFTSGQNFDISAQPIAPKNRAAIPRWNWSHKRFFTQVISMSDLRKGDGHSWSATWNQTDNNGKQLPRGAYRIEARLTMANGLKAHPIKITLVD